MFHKRVAKYSYGVLRPLTFSSTLNLPSIIATSEAHTTSLATKANGLATAMLSSLPSFLLPNASSPPYDTFSCFQNLSPELRHEIWCHAAKQRRFIRIVLYDDSIYECRGSWETGDGSSIVHTLFHVNREARQAALLVFRICLPCHFYHRRRTAYLNPALDILFIETCQSSGRTPVSQRRFVNFIHHLKTEYDPRGVGILNLALSADGMNDFRTFTSGDNLDGFDAAHKESFRETLRQLHHVFVVVGDVPPPSRAHYPGPLLHPVDVL